MLTVVGEQSFWTQSQSLANTFSQPWVTITYVTAGCWLQSALISPRALTALSSSLPIGSFVMYQPHKMATFG